MGYIVMKTTKVFKCGNSQAVRLPRGFTFNNKEVEIFKRENEIVVPDGDTVFKYGDKVTVIGEPLSIVEFQKLYISA